MTTDLGLQIFLQEKNALMHKHMMQFMMLAFKTKYLFWRIISVTYCYEKLLSAGTPSNNAIIHVGSFVNM
jgi:hypothetical protein